MRFIKYAGCFFLIMMAINLNGCQVPEKENLPADSLDKDKKTVAVSIVPQAAYVKAVAGDSVNVVTMIPPGHSPANYEPTPDRMVLLSEAELYFSIDVPTEQANILNKAKALNKKMKVVSLNHAVEEVYPYLMLNEEGQELKDPHIWLSPKRVKIMINVIKDSLTEMIPENAGIYEVNAKKYLDDLDAADAKIREILSNSKQKSFVIYHPSLGYFAEEYGLRMLAIEEEGKEATVKKLQQVVDYMKKEKIKVIFYQEEFDSNQAETIAKEVGGVTMKVNPLASDYIENLIEMASIFAEI